MPKPDIEHATSEELFTLSEQGMLTEEDCRILEHALLVQAKLKVMYSKYSREGIEQSASLLSEALTIE